MPSEQIENKPRRGGPPRKIHEQAAKRVELSKRDIHVSDLLLQGHTYRQIATEIKVGSTNTIHESVKRLLKIWREEHQHNVDEWVAIELEKIGRVESEAWEGWERSKRPGQTVAVKTAKLVMRGGKGKERIEMPAEQVEKTETTKEQVGDPRFLELALKSAERRCALLGLNAPEKVAPTDPTGTKEYGADLNVEERAARVAAVVETARTRRARSTADA